MGPGLSKKKNTVKKKMTDMQSSKVFFYFYSFRSIENQAKGGKSPKIAPKMQVQREAMEENAANIWEREAATIAER